MKYKNGDRRGNVVDLTTYRASRPRHVEPHLDDSELVTDIRFSITRSGRIVAARPRLDTTHLLAVLSWCQDLSALALDSYLDATA